MDYSEVNTAIYIRDVCKRYGNGPPVIRNICMNVNKGSIYGLLGASGCGKTSLLSCIVGIHKWDSGDVFVYGERQSSKGSRTLGRICGYMPQDVSLYDSLTFYESAIFFGKLYNMSPQDVESQIKFLANLLNMTKLTDQIIGTLSGGEQRRVSLAVTLLHSPDLIILDEPTVGMDPMLRKSIWEHLYNLAVNQERTIIITTHYTEEANLSNMIGIMRNGRMLAEDTPSNLLSTFNCTLLEDVTLKLCRADESSNINVTDIILACNQKVKKFKFKSSWKETIESTVAKHQGIPVGLFKRSTEFDNIITGDVEITKKMSKISKTSHFNDIYHQFRKVQGITIVQALNILRQKVFLAFFLLLPTIQGSLMFNTMGRNPREMNIGVVNEEVVNWTSLCSAEHFLKDSCDLTFLSCKYLQEIESNDVVNLIPMNSVKQARIKVYDGDLKGYIAFPANFSYYTLESFATRPFSSNESLKGSKIRMHLDLSEYVASLFMLQHFFESYSAFLERLAESCQMNGIIAKIPIEFKTPVYGSLDDSYTEFFVPGIILCFSFMLTSTITAILYITDRENGTLLRGQVAGLRKVHILLGYITTQGLLGILQIVLWSLTCYIWLGYSVRGPIWLYFLICLLVCICAIAFGLLLGIVCSDSVQAMVIQIFLSLFIFLCGGATWPLEAFPTFARYVGYFVPTTLPTLSIRSVVVRGLTLTHPLVWPGVVSIIAWILVLILCLTVIIP